VGACEKQLWGVRAMTAKNTNPAEPRTSQRGDLNHESSNLRIAVVNKKLLGASEYELCTLTDISHGGLGMASKWLDAKMGQKLHLELQHGHKKYTARGIVARITTRESVDHFGIAFIYAPPELDQLIALFLQEQTLAGTTAPAPSQEGNKRHGARRIAVQDTQVYARKTDSTDPFLLCQVDNISKGGMGFYCASKIDRVVPFPISMRISLPPDATEIVGTVHYVSKKHDGYYYGMEYDQVSKEFFQLLDKLEELSPFVASTTASTL
jgi:hypothetical protein